MRQARIRRERVVCQVELQQGQQIEHRQQPHQNEQDARQNERDERVAPYGYVEPA